MSPAGACELRRRSVTCAARGSSPIRCRYTSSRLLRREDPRVADQSRRGLVAHGQHERAAGVTGPQGARQSAASGAQPSGEGELPDELVTVQETRVDLAGCGEYAHRDRQVEAPSVLGQFGGSEVDGDSLARKPELEREQGAAHPILGFFHRGLGESDDGEGRQSAAQVNLHRDEGGFDPGTGPAEHHCKGHEASRVSPSPPHPRSDPGSRSRRGRAQPRLFPGHSNPRRARLFSPLQSRPSGASG